MLTEFMRIQIWLFWLIEYWYFMKHILEDSVLASIVQTEIKSETEHL